MPSTSESARSPRLRAGWAARWFLCQFVASVWIMNGRARQQAFVQGSGARLRLQVRRAV